MATSHERLRLKGVRCLKLSSFRSSRRKLPLPQKLCQGAVPASFLITEIAGHLPFLRLVARLSCKAGEIVLTFSILKQASFRYPYKVLTKYLIIVAVSLIPRGRLAAWFTWETPSASKKRIKPTEHPHPSGKPQKIKYTPNIIPSNFHT